jgi:hypothetical protein
MMEENYYALLICILKPVTIEQSFDLWEGRTSRVRNISITKADVEDMVKMKQKGMTYSAIGELYGLTKEATYRRIKRYREALVCGKS